MTDLELQAHPLRHILHFCDPLAYDEVVNKIETYLAFKQQKDKERIAHVEHLVVARGELVIERQNERDVLQRQLDALRAQKPVATYTGPEFTRYCIEWADGFFPVGSKLYAEPVLPHEPETVLKVSEPVLLQYRWKDTNPNTVTSGQWYEWETVDQLKYDNIEQFIGLGYAYEVRKLGVVQDTHASEFRSEWVEQAIKEAGLTKVYDCCGVPHKYCSTDTYRGELQAFSIALLRLAKG